MKKIFLSLFSIGLVAALTFGASRAFFFDTEKSSDNLFEAGAIDLEIDNTSYYNGVHSDDTSWNLRNLTVEKFFNFTDLKPGDWGEDTISIHVNSNPAYVCANINITENSDNGITEPEDEVDGVIDQKDGTDDGDLAGELNFLFWNDDGDNVLESDETPFAQGPASAVLSGATYPLADSLHNFLDNGPGLKPETTYHIGKAWCFGKLRTDPVQQGKYNDPTANSGITCDGENVGNISQTDRLLGDITFYAVQTRHNEGFLCSSWNPNPEVVNDYLDIGNTDSETGHNLSGWSDAWENGTWGGNYGGGSSDQSFRLLLGRGDGCTDNDRSATFIMEAGGGTATKLTLEHLDGKVNDSFELYINGDLRDTYAAGTTGVETWKTTTFTFPGVTGTVNVELRASQVVGDWCNTWGQVAFSNARLQ